MFGLLMCPEHPGTIVAGALNLVLFNLVFTRAMVARRFADLSEQTRATSARSPEIILKLTR